MNPLLDPPVPRLIRWFVVIGLTLLIPFSGGTLVYSVIETNANSANSALAVQLAKKLKTNQAADHAKTSKQNASLKTADSALLSFAEYLLALGEHQCPPAQSGCPVPPVLP